VEVPGEVLVIVPAGVCIAILALLELYVRRRKR
jgi:hypothetical protein